MKAHSKCRMCCGFLSAKMSSVARFKHYDTVVVGLNLRSCVILICLNVGWSKVMVMSDYEYLFGNFIYMLEY